MATECTEITEILALLDCRRLACTGGTLDESIMGYRDLSDE